MFAPKTWVGLAAVAVLAGCGGGDDASRAPTTTTSGSAAAARDVPKAARPVAELVPALERLGARGGCARAVALINRADLPDPEGGASRRNCLALGKLLRLIRGFKATAEVEFGSAAIVDGTAGGKQLGLVMALDNERRFKFTGFAFPRHQRGTEPRAGIDFNSPAAAFVKALRGGDCRAAHAAVASASRLAYASEQQFCSLFKANFLARPTGLGARLRADPGADLVDLGATRNVQFFGLPTAPAGYRTIIVGAVEKEGAFVYDVVPVER